VAFCPTCLEEMEPDAEDDGFWGIQE